MRGAITALSQGRVPLSQPKMRKILDTTAAARAGTAMVGAFAAAGTAVEIRASGAQLRKSLLARSLASEEEAENDGE